MNVRIQYPLSFTAGIYFNNQMQMNNYVAKLYMMTNTPDGAANNIAFDRIKHFVYSELDSSIFISSEHEEQCKRYIDAGLKITTFPGDPVDQVVGLMLFYKLSAIMEDRIIIGEIEVSSVIGEGLIYIHGDNENIDNLDQPAWWHTPDLIHCEGDLIDSDKIVTMHHSSMWRELDLQWPDIEDVTEEPNKEESGNTVVFADFKKLDETE
jgi:hypothetical protein